MLGTGFSTCKSTGPPHTSAWRCRPNTPDRTCSCKVLPQRHFRFPRSFSSKSDNTQQPLPDRGAVQLNGVLEKTEYDRTMRPAVFNEQRWQSHRSTWRYLRHVQGVVKSRTFKQLSKPLLFLTAVSTSIGAWETFKGGMEAASASASYNLTISPFELTSFALSLLLVFRTDASYARWAEALSTWTCIRSTSKELLRKSALWFEPTEQHMLAKWVLAFAVSIKAYVRNEPVEPALHQVLSKSEVALALKGGNAPHNVLQILEGVVASVHLNETREQIILEHLKNFTEALDTSDKLLRFPIPLSYTRHTSRFMVIWLSLLPFALWQQCGWASVPITVVIGFLLLGIEEIGVQIEEPFGTLPLDTIVQDIKDDLRHAIVIQPDITEYIKEQRPAAVLPKVAARNGL